MNEIDIFGDPIVVKEIEDDTVAKVSLWDFIKDLTQGKDNILRVTPAAKKDMKPYIINLALSMNIEDIMYANEMNIACGNSKSMVYDFYIHGLRKSRRRSKWAKSGKDKTIEMVKLYYNVNELKAQQYMRILTDKQLAEIKMKSDKGGKK
ncbi:MAG: DNA polymerase clamp loader subunit A [Ghiorsea sp.]